MQPGQTRTIIILALAALSLAVAASAPAAPGSDRTAVMWLDNGQSEEPAEAVLLETDVDIRVHGLLARSQVRQRFFNDSGTFAEGRYVFPLPDGAGVDSLEIRIGSRLVEGEIRPARKARETYRQAARSGQRAGLVEQERTNLFTTSVANIPPGEEVEIRIGFDQSVDFRDGAFRLAFPTTVAPRFIPGSPLPESNAPANGAGGWARDTHRVPDASRITPPVQHPDAEPVNPMRLELEIEPGMELSSLVSAHHELRVDERNGRWHATLEDGWTPSGRDFEFTWHPARSDEATTALFTESRNGRDYALVMMVPPEDHVGQQPPREVVLIIDTSGSMRGDPMRQARASLRHALDRLEPADRFNVIEFNHVTRALFDEPVPADEVHLDQARHFVDRLRAAGGTVMGPSLEKSMDGEPPEGMIRQIVFITDGIIGNEDEVLGLIQENIGQSRLFSVGIGHGVNSDFLRRGSRLGRGHATFIRDLDQIETRMAGLAEALERPVAHELDASWPAGTRVLPDPLPDLYSGQPVMMAARTEALPATLEVSGIRGTRPWSRTLIIGQAIPAEGVARHWAGQRIEALTDESLNSDRPDDAVAGEITETALEYGLVSDHTSLVAVDRTPVRTRQDAMQAHRIPTSLPEGRKLDGFFDTGDSGPRTAAMPATDTPAAERIGRGLAVLVLLALLFFGSRQREDTDRDEP